MQAVSGLINTPISFEQLSQKRMLEYFESNQIDLELASNPLWRAQYAAVSLYSISYIQTMDVVMVKQGGNFKPANLQDFRGKRIGCTLGYVYPEFEAEFKNGNILREDAPNESSNVQKLLIDRVDAIIIEKNTALYWMKELKVAPSQLEDVYVVGKYDIHFRLHKNKESWMPALNDALKTLIADGTIQKIAEKYTKQ
jgi:polar amino acid transport system substrate-binding protein